MEIEQGLLDRSTQTADRGHVQLQQFAKLLHLVLSQMGCSRTLIGSVGLWFSLLRTLRVGEEKEATKSIRPK